MKHWGWDMAVIPPGSPRQPHELILAQTLPFLSVCQANGTEQKVKETPGEQQNAHTCRLTIPALRCPDIANLSILMPCIFQTFPDPLVYQTRLDPNPGVPQIGRVRRPS